MHLRQAASRERFMLVFALPVVLAGCARGLPSDMPDESNGARGSGAPEPQLLSVAYTHEPSPAAVAGAVRKVVRRHNYVLEFGDYEAEVDPADGGRIVALRVDGQNALLERSASPEAYGSSFWPSPQSAWRWPPPPEFDKLAWNVEARDGRVLLESLTNEALGLAAKQALHADLGRGALIIEYTLENRGTKAVGVAPWQNTRLPPGGMTFFPSEEGSLPPKGWSGCSTTRTTPRRPRHLRTARRGGWRTWAATFCS
jgi:hypothetical protein